MSDLFGLAPDDLPAIGMWQPWASLVFEVDPAFRKRLETRSFPYPPKYHEATIAILATASFPARWLISDELDELATRAFGSNYRRTLPLGAYLGTVVLGGCQPTPNLVEHIGFADRIAGNWAPNRFGWHFNEPRPLAAPLPGKGKQGWWRFPRTTIEAAR